MEDLVPRTAYDVDETGYWERMPVVTGLIMAVCCTAITYATIGRDWPFRESAIRGMAGGFMFAVLFPSLLRWFVRGYTSRAYAGKGRFALAAPAGFDVAYRLLCSAIIGDSRAAVGGNLFIGRSGLSFVPFSGSPLTFPMPELKVAAVPAPTNALLRVVIPRPASLLEATGRDVRARFVLPTPSATITKILNALRSCGYTS